MNMPARSLLSTLVLTAFFFSCSDPVSNSKEKLLEKIAGVNWQLSHISEAGLSIGVPHSDSLFTIFFDAETGAAYIKDHCNSCNGSYEVNEESISFGNASCTLALCSSTKLNTTLVSELNSVTSFRIVDQELQLNSDDTWVKRVLHFRNSENNDPKEVLIANNENFDRESWDNGSYQVKLINIQNDSVTLNVSYSGCGVKDINMVFYNYFLESEPVQAYAFFPQINDACLAFFSDEYSFDLSLLKENYLELYPGDSGVIDISIRENGEVLEHFLYEF
ncbi:MAG: hypothetical protein BalsKO_30940 [Balneolaceae bacterium]